MDHAFIVHVLVVIGTLIVLEGLLSADNALVLAAMVKHLPHKQQKKALLYGLVGAVVFRFLMLLIGKWVMTVWQLSALGAGYLLFLATKHFWFAGTHSDSEEKNMKSGFWMTIVWVELTDIAFSIDSLMAAVALTEELWLTYIGVLLGVIMMRFVANGFLTVLDKWPELEHMAYALVAWLGLKLSYKTYEMIYPEHVPPPDDPAVKIIFWAGMAVITTYGILYAVWWKPKKIKKLA